MRLDPALRPVLAAQGVNLDDVEASLLQRVDGAVLELVAEHHANLALGIRLHDAGWRPIAAGGDGLGKWVHKRGRILIHSLAREADGEIWAHTSLSRRDGIMPTWAQVRDLHRLVYPDLSGVVVIPPEATHVNFREVAHVWTCLTRPSVPDFTAGLGTI